MFFLPLPFNKTSETFHEIRNPTKLLPTTVPSPELYIIYGKPTKADVLWHKLVDVNHVKAANCKLHQMNWLYSITLHASSHAHHASDVSTYWGEQQFLHLLLLFPSLFLLSPFLLPPSSPSPSSSTTSVPRPLLIFMIMLWL